MGNYLYIVYDLLAKNIMGGIMMARNHEVARRAFYEALAAKDSPIGQHPADYELWCIGEIYNNTADIVPFDSGVITVASGKDWLDANTNKGA